LVEEFAGVSIYRVNSHFIYSADKYPQGNSAFNAGAKFNFYDAKITNENSEIQFFFSRAYFGSLIFGYRYNF
jgi:hypothetical protein